MAVFRSESCNLGGSNLLGGGPGTDMIRGGAHGDVIWGNLGDDVIEGHTGDDLIYQGPFFCVRLTVQ